ncbi:uncharacterized protein LOC112603302 isoform X1 [Melanaphis sacchari]|uniref:uncharacterized protein LOC112603302 isoform X1 n=1 Tax=Melanaphis sacchari TaxID=742174 RepID=UPI000DC15334|nr:uncharacterized protein LOC112603302 isoform X1 [Melanaphis sacchari]XP_025207606.1 uncharacterized protein LOC112603302 isoform X1 [Melanaphis sacchari]
MYAAAGGASLASRRHKPKHRNTADADALIHQQFQRRFQQHQQQYAPASVEHQLRASSSLTPSTPMSPFGQIRLSGPFDPAENKTAASVAWPGPVGPSPDSDGTAPGDSILIHLPAEAHLKWTKKNKIHDALSFGGGDGADRRLYELQQGAAANTLLYVGLCSVALGLIIAFVGTGEKGFKTVQLRFIGPGMIAIGVCCCVVRIMLCFCPPTFCFKRRRHKGGGGASDKMAEFYKYMPFRNHPMGGNANATVAAAEPLTGVAVETVPMTVLKPALKRVSMAADQQPHIVYQQTKRMPKATPEASLDSSMEHLIEQDDHLYTKDEVSSNKNLSNLKSTLTFEDSLNVATKMMVKSFEELNNTSSTPSTDSADQHHQELVLSAVNLTK